MLSISLTETGDRTFLKEVMRDASASSSADEPDPISPLVLPLILQGLPFPWLKARLGINGGMPQRNVALTPVLED
jgi:hypothetical protein